LGGIKNRSPKIGHLGDGFGDKYGYTHSGGFAGKYAERSIVLLASLLCLENISRRMPKDIQTSQ